MVDAVRKKRMQGDESELHARALEILGRTVCGPSGEACGEAPAQRERGRGQPVHSYTSARPPRRPRRLALLLATTLAAAAGAAPFRCDEDPLSFRFGFEAFFLTPLPPLPPCRLAPLPALPALPIDNGLSFPVVVVAGSTRRRSTLALGPVHWRLIISSFPILVDFSRLP